MTPGKGPLAGALGRVSSRVYGWVVSRRNRSFDRGQGVEALGVPVISVGNLSVGGTGKTPMVMWVVDRVRAKGMRPAIAMRGYGAKREGVSDEQAEYADRCPGIVVVAQPDRISGLRARAGAYDCVVLDDGFQHRRIARDLEIVLVDATRDVFADRCLPAGWLREPVESLSRAHVVVLTRTDLADAECVARMESRVREMAPGVVVVRAMHSWTGLDVAEASGEDRVDPVSCLAGMRVVVACGIGHPDALVAQVEHAGAAVVARFRLRDHAEWTDAEIARVGSATGGADAVVVTGKDWVKLRSRVWGAGGWGVPVVRPRVAMDLGGGSDTVGAMVDRAIGGGAAGIIDA